MLRYPGAFGPGERRAVAAAAAADRIAETLS